MKNGSKHLLWYENCYKNSNYDMTMLKQCIESLDLIISLQLGQEEWESNHISIQTTWKRWLHFGSNFMLSPSQNSAKQMAQLESNDGGVDSAEWVLKIDVGKAIIFFFLSPELRLREVIHCRGSVRTRFAHWNTHCNIVFRPRAQSKAQTIAATSTIEFRPCCVEGLLHGLLIVGIVGVWEWISAMEEKK
jgi:hypothetical protein